MDRLVAAIMLICYSTDGYTQYTPCYYYYVNMAEYEMEVTQKMERVKMFLNMAREIQELTPQHIVLESAVLAVEGDTSRCLVVLKEAMSLGITKSFLSYYPSLKDLSAVPWVSDSIGLYGEMYLQNRQNKKLCAIIDRLSAVDQFIRTHIWPSLAREESTRHIGYKIGVTTDSILIRQVRKLVEDEGGLPSLEDIGYDTAEKLFTLLLHGLTEYVHWDDMDSLLKLEIGKGHLSPAEYAFIVDRRDIVQHDKRLHVMLENVVFEGTTFGHNNFCTKERGHYCPIRDIHQVDYRRVQIGLLPLGMTNELSYRRMTLPAEYEPVDVSDILDCNN